MEKRFLNTKFQTRDSEDGKLYIEGYFAVFGDVYEIYPGCTESIREGAFTEALQGDVRALYNHNQDIVLGRTSAGTLTLNEDDHGLFGRIEVNQDDTAAMDAYRRIQRGDVSGCSFGFEYAHDDEQMFVNSNGDVHWTITKIRTLYEVSPCAFPAYQATNVQARKKDFERIRKETAQAWRTRQLARLKGEQNHGTENPDAQKEN